MFELRPQRFNLMSRPTVDMVSTRSEETSESTGRSLTCGGEIILESRPLGFPKTILILPEIFSLDPQALLGLENRGGRRNDHSGRVLQRRRKARSQVAPCKLRQGDCGGDRDNSRLLWEGLCMVSGSNGSARVPGQRDRIRLDVKDLSTREKARSEGNDCLHIFLS